MEGWLLLENESNLTKELCPLNETTAMHSTWVFKYFGECVLNVRQYLAFIIGMLSILCWLIAQVPQLVTNCRSGNADKALSFWFLLMWLFGDATNLIGALLTKQLATQVVTAVYFVLIDTFTMLQFLYYLLKNQGVKGLLSCCKMSSKRKKTTTVLAVLVPGIACSLLFAGSTLQRTVYHTHNLWYSTPSHAGRTLLGLNGQVVDRHSGANIAGYIMGCLSGLFYMGSRIPQLVKNLMRCSVEGLSLYMFLLALAGNITYGLGIFLYSVDAVFLLQKLPWLVGSVGTIVFDIIIVLQFVTSQCLGLSCSGSQRSRSDSDNEKAALFSSVRDSDDMSNHEDCTVTVNYGTIIQCK